MDLETIVYSIIIGVVVSVIGGWTLIYYVTLRDKEYERLTNEQDRWVNEQVQKQIDKDLEELRNKPKNQTVKANFDDDVPF